MEEENLIGIYMCVYYRYSQYIQIALALQTIEIKLFFCKTASLQSYRICVEATRHLSAILFALLAHERVIVARFGIAFVHCYIVHAHVLNHWTLILTTWCSFA